MSSSNRYSPISHCSPVNESIPTTPGMNPHWFNSERMDMIWTHCWAATPSPKALRIIIRPKQSYDLYLNVEKVISVFSKSNWKTPKNEIINLIQQELHSAQLVSRM